MDDKNQLELEILQIKTFNSKEISNLLGITRRQARNIQTGRSDISNTNAQVLKNKLSLSLKGFAEIRKQYLEGETQ